MKMNFPESDWKHLTRLKPLAIERLCRRILAETRTLIDAAAEGEHHQAYLALFRHIQEQDRVVADCFDNWRRSQAVFLLMHWRAQRLLTEEEFAGFSAETRNGVDSWLSRN
jgi:hypothetical protein